MPPRARILLPDRDHEPGDWRGAFCVEAQRLASLYQLPAASVVEIDISREDAARRRQVFEALRAAGPDPLDLVALICHGWDSGIQLGFRLQHVGLLAAALASAGAATLAVVLYACSTAKGQGGQPGTAGADDSFAVQLAHALRALAPKGAPPYWIRVDAHVTAGHCCSNPYVWRSEGPQDSGWLIAPTSPLWARWTQELADRAHSTLRFRFPLMTREEIEAELSA